MLSLVCFVQSYYLAYLFVPSLIGSWIYGRRNKLFSRLFDGEGVSLTKNIGNIKKIKRKNTNVGE